MSGGNMEHIVDLELCGVDAGSGTPAHGRPGDNRRWLLSRVRCAVRSGRDRSLGLYNALHMLVDPKLFN
ncbi:unnamed protein product, partial [Brenthis ino]